MSYNLGAVTGPGSTKIAADLTAYKYVTQNVTVYWGSQSTVQVPNFAAKVASLADSVDISLQMIVMFFNGTMSGELATRTYPVFLMQTGVTNPPDGPYIAANPNGMSIPVEYLVAPLVTNGELDWRPVIYHEAAHSTMYTNAACGEAIANFIQNYFRPVGGWTQGDLDMYVEFRHLVLNQGWKAYYTPALSTTDDRYMYWAFYRFITEQFGDTALAPVSNALKAVTSPDARGLLRMNAVATACGTATRELLLLWMKRLMSGSIMTQNADVKTAFCAALPTAESRLPYDFNTFHYLTPTITGVSNIASRITGTGGWEVLVWTPTITAEITAMYGNKYAFLYIGHTGPGTSAVTTRHESGTIFQAKPIKLICVVESPP